MGLTIAGVVPDPSHTFFAAAAIVIAGALSLFGSRDGSGYRDAEHAHVRDWHDFGVVFVARALVFFGLVMLQTFVLYYSSATCRRLAQSVVRHGDLPRFAR